MQNFTDYTIPNPAVVPTFNDESLGKELVHTYTNIDGRQWTAKLWDTDGSTCGSTEYTAGSGLAIVTNTMVPDPSPAYAGGDGTLTVEVDVTQKDITTGGMWSYAADIATLKYCIRVDLYADADGSGTVDTANPNDSVSFHESIVTVTFDMKQCIGTDKGTVGSCAMVEEVDILRADEDLETPAQVSVNYDLQAYWRADGTGCIWGAAPTATPLDQQDIIYICVAVNTEDVRIKEIRHLDLTHGAATITAIEGGTGSPVLTDVTAVTGLSSQAVVISTRLVANFFTDDTDMVDISGVALIEFYDDLDRRRELYVPLLRGNERQLQASGDTMQGFHTQVEFTSSSARIVSIGAGIVAAVVTMLI